MVSGEDREYLIDILDAISKVDYYTVGLTWELFQSNDLIIDAVTRKLEIIGEATTRLSPEFREEYHTQPWSKMIGMRNRLIHGYGEVDNEIVWQTCRENLPDLKKLIESII